MWGKGIAYPLIGDKVFVRDRYEPPDEIWEVDWITTGQWGTRYTLIPWPRGIRRSDAPDQRRDFPFHKLVPLDPLTRIYVEIEEASDLLS